MAVARVGFLFALCYAESNWQSRTRLGCSTCMHRAGLRIPHSLVLSMARFRLSSHNLGVELDRHQGVVWFARGCMRCAALGMHDLPVDDEANLL
jgi:hypothetical protein